MPKCENCGAEVPYLYNAPGGKKVCCSHCVFNPLGCKCSSGEYGKPQEPEYRFEKEPPRLPPVDKGLQSPKVRWPE